MPVVEVDISFAEGGDQRTLTAKFVNELTLSQPLEGFTIELTAVLRPKIIQFLPIISLALPATIKEKTPTQSLSEGFEARNVRTARAVAKCAKVELKFMSGGENDSEEADLQGLSLDELIRILDLEHGLLLGKGHITPIDLALTLRYIARKSDIEMLNIGEVNFSGESEAIMLSGMTGKLKSWYTSKYNKAGYITSELNEEDERRLQELAQFALRCNNYIGRDKQLEEKKASEIGISKKELGLIYKALMTMLNHNRIIIEKPTESPVS